MTQCQSEEEQGKAIRLIYKEFLGRSFLMLNNETTACCKGPLTIEC